MAKKKEPPYAVGYGRPPVETRFPPGVSGNPAGRPKHALNVRTMLTKILSEKVVVTQNGKKKTVTKFEAAMTKLAHRAIEGDARASRQIIPLLLSAEQETNQAQTQTQPLSRAELKVLNNLVKNTTARGKGELNGKV